MTKVVTLLKSLTAREIFRRCPQVKKQLWGGEFWTDGYRKMGMIGSPCLIPIFLTVPRVDQRRSGERAVTRSKTGNSS